MMGVESTAILSLGSILGLVTLFYTWHKDSKDTAKQIQKLETEVEVLKEHKQDIREVKEEIATLKTQISNNNLTLTRIDTNVQHLMDERQQRQ
jgi:hypothetical protein